MTMWLLVLLAIVVVGALMWRTERRRRATHPGSGVADGPRGGESSGPFSGGWGSAAHVPDPAALLGRPRSPSDALPVVLEGSQGH
jgi:hypothetical protein